MMLPHWLRCRWTKWKFTGNWHVKDQVRQVTAKQYERECSVCGKVQQETKYL